MPRKPNSSRAKSNGAAPLERRPRRGRPPTIDHEHLLRVAREVFLEQGIRATTLEVAARAGVSEGVLFHRFKTKEGLFRAAMALQMEDVPKLLSDIIDRQQGLDLREALLQMGSAFAEIGRIGVPLMMMSWSNPTSCGPGPNQETQSKFRTLVKRLAMFFEAQMEAGKLRRVDAEILARVFLGAIHHYCMVRIIDPQTDALPQGMFMRGLVDVLLGGAQASAEAEPFAPIRR